MLMFCLRVINLQYHLFLAALQGAINKPGVGLYVYTVDGQLNF